MNVNFIDVISVITLFVSVFGFTKIYTEVKVKIARLETRLENHLDMEPSPLVVNISLDNYKLVPKDK